MKTTLVLLAVLFLWAPASAQATGTRLLKMCQAAEKHFDRQTITNDEAIFAGFCVGFISGVEQTDQRLAVQGKKPGGACLPNGGADQRVRVVLKWMREHPDKLEMSGVEVVVEALKAAYPCH